MNLCVEATTKKIWRQYQLVSPDGQLILRTWLRDDSRLTVGTEITLTRGYEAERRWVIRERTEFTLERPPTLPWKVML